jgi:hypothetical protein
LTVLAIGERVRRVPTPSRDPRRIRCSPSALAVLLAAVVGCGGSGATGPADAGPKGFVGNWSSHLAFRLACPGQADTIEDGAGTENLVTGSAPGTVVDLGTTSGCNVTFLVTGDEAVLQSGGTCPGVSAGGFSMLVISEAVLQLDGDTITFSASGTAVESDAGTSCSFTETGMWARL